jgi:hypothetical protein
MPASDHLQLKLFYGGKELRDKISTPHDRFARESVSEMWNRKAEEAKEPLNDDEWWGERQHGAGVYDSISEDGWSDEPLNIDGPGWDNHLETKTDGSFAAYDGHHRIAAAADIEEKSGRNVWIPVTYGD